MLFSNFGKTRHFLAIAKSFLNLKLSKLARNGDLSKQFFFSEIRILSFSQFYGQKTNIGRLIAGPSGITSGTSGNDALVLNGD